MASPGGKHRADPPRARRIKWGDEPAVSRGGRRPVHARLLESERTAEHPRATARPHEGRRYPTRTYRSGRSVRGERAAQLLTPAAEEYARRSAIRGTEGRPSVRGRAASGAAAGAAAGAPLAAATGGLSIPIGAAIGGTGGAVAGRRARREYDRAMRNPETGAARRALLAEFTVCMLIAALAPLAKKEDTPSRLVKQMTGLMLLFFILSLISAAGRGAARMSAAFGGVVTVVLVVSQRDLFVKIAELFNRQSNKVGKTSSGFPKDPGGEE